MASEEPSRAATEQRAFVDALLSAPASNHKIGAFFYSKTNDLMQSESFLGVDSKTRNVDIVRDVLKSVPVYWACDIVCSRPRPFMLCEDSTDSLMLDWHSIEEQERLERGHVHPWRDVRHAGRHLLVRDDHLHSRSLSNELSIFQLPLP